SGLSAAQIQTIVNLLQSFGIDAGTLAHVEAALGGSASAAANAASTGALSCVNLTNTLNVGATDAQTGGDVSALQAFLGIAPTTGYFGQQTRAAVGQWQEAHGIVASGSADLGLVGPKTRAAMSCSGSN